MNLLIISDEDVRRLLDIESCIDVVRDALISLAREELYQPLRTIMRPPGAAGTIGLMPSYRGGDASTYALKEIVVSHGNPARGLDAHQGAVLLHDGETGQLIAVMNAAPVTEIRTAAVSAVATHALARTDSARVAILGAGVQARAHIDAMRAVLDGPVIRLWARRPDQAQALAARTGVTTARTIAEALDGAAVVCTATSSVDPIVEYSWLASGAHINAVGSSIPTTRELDTDTIAAASLFVDRRESTLNESGDFLIPHAEGAIGPDHIKAELGEVLTEARPGRTSEDELTVFKSLGLGIEDLAAAELVVRRAREHGVGQEVAF